MCGITGAVDYSSIADKRNLRAMLRQIEYRGPDSWGEFYSKDKSAALGIRRLSIIDLTTGDQPISNEDKQVTVVYNGEIYNYMYLRNRLEKKGHTFSTESDTEVLVHLYEEYGEDLSKHLNGMFAFAIWDEKNKRLVVSRDRAGIKPLYYTQKGKRFIFGSEPKTILSYPGIERKINRQSLFLYTYLGYLPGDSSIFDGIKKLLPGTTLVYSRSGIKIKKYFSLYDIGNISELSLDDLLDRSVEMQLNADVPVGVFLSGGLDSSLITHYISKRKKLKSFSIGFSNPNYDESSFARQVSKRFGTQHYSEEFNAADVPEIFEKIVKMLDEPLADASILPTYKVNALAKRYVKVVLSGDGGDELFGGYPTHQAHLLSKYIPTGLTDILSYLLKVTPETVVNFLPTSFKDYPKKKLASIVLKGLKMENPMRHLYWMRTFFMGDSYLLEKPPVKAVKRLVPAGALGDASQDGRVIDYYTYLSDDFLVKADRASMFNSIEVRVPYLDNSVINYAFKTNNKHFNLINTKILLRELASRYVPEIAKRPKKGFGIPLAAWLKNELKDFSYDLLNNDALYQYLPKGKVMNLWDEHQKGEFDNSGTIWMVIMLSGWINNWLKA